MSSELEQSKLAIKELVEEVLFCENEIARLKDINSKLLEKNEELESGTAIRSLKQMLVDQQKKYDEEKRDGHGVVDNNNIENDSHNRVLFLEKSFALEKSLRQEAENKLLAVQNELDNALKQARSSSITSLLSKEEMETERARTHALKEDYDRVNRSNETAQRELNAEIKRYEQIVLEMRQVMEQRDAAINLKDDAVNRARLMENAVNSLKDELVVAQSKEQGLVERMNQLQAEKENVMLELQSEKRAGQTNKEDLKICKVQLGNLVNERDIAIREYEELNERCVLLANEKKALANAKKEIEKSFENVQIEFKTMEEKMKRDAKRLSDAENELKQKEASLNQMENDALFLKQEIKSFQSNFESARDEKMEAERKHETSRRQVRMLNEEISSILESRDLAMVQRENFAANVEALAKENALLKANEKKLVDRLLKQEREAMEKIAIGKVTTVINSPDGKRGGGGSPSRSPPQRMPPVNSNEVYEIRKTLRKILVLIGENSNNWRQAYNVQEEISACREEAMDIYNRLLFRFNAHANSKMADGEDDELNELRNRTNLLESELKSFQKKI